MTDVLEIARIEVPDSLWPRTLRDHGFEDDEKVDAFYEPKDPKAPYRTHAIYAPSRIMRQGKNKVPHIVTLFVHELGHGIDFPLNTHPYDFRGVWKHAHSVGYDDRAYSGWLRLRKNKELRAAALPWLKMHGMA